MLKKYTIIYAEDDPLTQQNMKEFLSDIFKSVFVASNGEEALKLYKSKKPNAILMDIDMPKLDGLSVAQEIRKVDTTTPIIMLTAFSDRDKLLKATELRLLKYLIKPIQPQKLDEALELLELELSKINKHIIELGDGCFWNSDTKELIYNDKKVNLTPKEKRLLELLIQRRNYTITFAEIMNELWEDSFEKEISINSVKNVVSSLRKHLPPNCIKSIYGQGYSLK